MPRVNSLDHDEALRAAGRLAAAHPDVRVPPGGSYAAEGTEERERQDDFLALNVVAVAFACGDNVPAALLKRARRAMSRW